MNFSHSKLGKLMACVLSLVLVLALSLGLTSCGGEPSAPQSASGVSKATVTVPVNPSTGRTSEQDNIAERLLTDNAPGALQYLYVISPFTGDVIISSSVKGKVTSSGKRLTPTTVNGSTNGFPVNIGGQTHYTSEVLQDDGTYGSSVPYIYWRDVNNVKHQQIIGAALIHISTQPVRTSKTVLNLDSATTSTGK